MPEAPEVAHITDQLYKIKMSNSLLLIDISILGGRYKRHGSPEDWDIFKQNLPLQWTNVQCKGKFIYFTFQNKYEDKFYLWNTLAMTGGWTTTKQKHSHIKLTFTEKTNLYFNDMRCFGTLHVCFNKNEHLHKLNSIGTSWLGLYNGTKPRTINVQWKDFEKVATMYENQNICKFLMNQSFFSGIGNYLLSEVLYDSKTYPWSNVSDVKIKKLYESITLIVQNSYNLDGVSLRDYHGVDGEIGEYQNFLQVYGQKRDSNGNNVIKVQGPHGRSLYWVPLVQKSALL